MSTSIPLPDAAAVAVPDAGVALDERDARGLLDAAAGAVRTRRAAEVAEMRVAAQWAVRHGHPAGDRDPMTTPGGEGTPGVREYALPELAMARDTHYATTRALLADTLDLIHRLPKTWGKVVALACEPWVARRVAVISRTVPATTVGIVDAAVAAAITGHAPSTVIEIAQAKTIEADPETHAMRREYDRHRRYVSLSRSDEFGYRVIIARVTAGDAAWIDALVDRVADILALEHGHDHTHDELRSLALGWLARPADLLKLLLDHSEHSTPGHPDQADSPATADPDGDGDGDVEGLADTETGPTGGDVEPAPETDPAESTDPESGPGRPAWAPDHLAATVERLAGMSPRQLASLRGRGRVFVHLSEEAVRCQAGIARIEGAGPMLVQSLAEVLGHADIHLTPVIDLNGRVRTDSYEHPTSLKDRVWLLTGGETFPYAPRTATRDQVDFDHPTPYQADGPPGQTGTHNSGPLRRRHHRWKTHGGFRCRQAGPGRHLWQTPHGDCYLVDHTGTGRLPQPHAEAILTAPEGVDIYPTDFTINLAYNPG